MNPTLVLLPGDGIGPEVMAEAVRILEVISKEYDHAFDLQEGLIGGCAIDACGAPLPDETVEKLRNADAVLLGAIGGPKWDLGSVRPEQGLLGLRQCLGTFANIRPVSIFPALRGASPLKPEKLDKVDLVVVRELTGGIYFGKKQEGNDQAMDVCSYSALEVERVTRIACELACTRSGRLTSVDKANVLATSRLWRKTVQRVVENEFPQLELEHMLVDSAAMHLIRKPSHFDVVVTENMFGDILTDEASMLAGSMGLLPSASFGEGRASLYEPIHGSAPDIAGKGIANPYAMILCVAMMLRHSFQLEQAARRIEEAVLTCINDGILTPDLAINQACTTKEVGSAVIEAIQAG